jgi:hypothetical protein
MDERFTDGLDEAVWTPAYLPAWSSRAAAAATYSIDEHGLHLNIPPEHGLWCPDLHDGPLRVSAVQSGNWSGPVGSSRGQQPFREGLVVAEAQPTVLGFTPHYAFVEVTCRARIGPGSMFSAWLIGIEDEPNRCGEICLVEVFGEAPNAIGCGIHQFRDPALNEEFSTVPLELDIAEFHRYAVDWQPSRVDFLIDGECIKSLAQAPDYPMQLILGVFDFPDRPHDTVAVPELVVGRVLGRNAVRDHQQHG